MAYGPVNVPGVSWGELNGIGTKLDSIDKKIDGIKISTESITNTLGFTPTLAGGGNL